jgi:hypothetical protein
MKKIENEEMREIAPEAPNPLANGNWLIGGVEISDFTLRQQRLYAQETGGTWTRPKGGGSWNSVEA